MGIQVVPDWMAELEEEDVAFLKNFLLCSGSLKEIAGLYGVTYPTVRLRLDKIIQKVRLGEEYAGDPFVALVKRLALNEKLDFDTAKLLITEYKNKKEVLEMSMAGTLLLLIFPILFLLALVIGLGVFLAVRKNERKKREEFLRAAQRRSQEKELEKMKIDDL